jgi:16S rRNA (guanine966-N2)-methyltransferase
MSSLRVSGGFLRGRKVPLPGHDLRPTSSKARQAFFNIIGDQVQNARFLDLFAGSGIFSIEAISRGASRATAVDQNRIAMKNLEALAREWKLSIETVAADSITALKKLRPDNPFDLVYADPPYQYPRYDDLLEAIDKLPLNPGATVAIEHDRRRVDLASQPLQQLVFRKAAAYGNVAISLFDKAE